MTKKTTKRALLSSIMALVLCFAMLLGTTYAWLTDSVSTASNVITSGNLVIDVQYTLDGENWANLDGANDLFQKGLWEPGHTEVVALKITNKGSLALKYKADINVVDEAIGKTETGKDIVLSDILTITTVNQQVNMVGDILLGMVFNGSKNTDTSNTKTFKDGKGLANDQELLPGEAHYLIVTVDMDENVGNEVNHNGINIPDIDFGINVVATQYTYENDTFGNQYDKNAVYPVVDIREFQAAINEAGDGDVIQFTSDFAGDVTFTQKKDVNVVIDGNGHKFSGNILVDGKSATYTGAGLTIKNVNFSADAIATDACIQLGNGTNATRYTCNVTIEGCTFDVPGVVGVKSYTGGDKNVTIKDCVATERAHSLAQLKGVDGVVIENCTVNSVRGVNLNNSNNVKIVGSTFDVEKYAVRFGESANSVQEVFEITNCTLTSANGDGDAVIVLRAGATDATLTLTNTTLNGAIQMTGHENANIIVG